MRAILPTRSLLLLMAIAAIDLISTAVLHAQGLIVERNPLMRPFIDRGEWQFAAAKAATMACAWWLMAGYGQTNRKFVRTACLIGSGAYVTLWLVWFFAR